MSTRKIGIYADEYLSLLELMAAEKDLPGFDFLVCGSEKLLDELPAESADYFTQNTDDLLSTELVVLLAPLPDEQAFFQKYNGIVIDAAEPKAKAEYADITRFDDPLISMLTEIAEINDDLFITLSLPAAIYGKAGVEALMGETRAIYSFDDYEESIFPMPLAFNTQFYADKLPENKWGHEISRLRKLAKLNLRINPVSTVFIADLYCAESIDVPEELRFDAPEGDFTISDISDSRKLMLLNPENDARMITIAGDYLHMKTGRLVKEISRALDSTI